ncbi:MAG: hypothetical protein P8I55_08040 [Crocinitomix sp.]|nr:hypothetical protein [Crocinitomix sp.]
MTNLNKGILITLAIIGGFVFLFNPGETEYRTTDNDVYLKITANTTDLELQLIQADLKETKNISMDYSKSNFSNKGELQELNLAVDCNDGHSGKTNISSFGLLIGGYGFHDVMDENGEAVSFRIGRI